MSKSNINKLFQNAQDEGNLSNQSMNALTVVDIGQEIEAAMGVEIDQVQSSEVVLLTMMPDDSGSIGAIRKDSKNPNSAFVGEKLMRKGHNLVINALIDSKQKDNILAHNRYLNGQILYPYVPIDQAIEMDKGNYQAIEGTPLYDQTVILLGTVLAKAQEFYDNGVAVRTITLIITDGDDLHSVRANPAMVKSIVDDMYKSEDHIIAAMGIDDGQTDFRQVFKDMGIRDNWILIPGTTESEIRKAFQVFSQSAVRASQSAVSFSKTAIGGFGS